MHATQRIRTLLATAIVAGLCTTWTQMARGDSDKLERDAWSARDRGDWTACARHFAEAATQAHHSDDTERAARNGYWTARCARSAGKNEPARAWARWTARRGPETLHAMVAAYRDTTPKTARHQTDTLIEAIIEVESGANPDAVSHAGAIGLMQIMPETGHEVLQSPHRTRVLDCLTEPKCNRNVGTRYLVAQLETSQGSLIDALAAYNAGPGRAARWRRHRQARQRVDPMESIDRLPFAETRTYVARVLAATARREQAHGSTSSVIETLAKGHWPHVHHGPSR